MSLKKIKKEIKDSTVEYQIRSFRLPVKLIERLKVTAKSLGTSPNDLVKRLLEESLVEGS
jgi:predicted DNA-binding protein